MKKKIEIVSENRAYDGYIKIEEGVVRESDGTNEGITYSRFAVNRPNASATLVYNSDEDTVILVRQHRYPVHVKGGFDSHTLEIPAGKVDFNEDPRDAAVREIK